MNITQLNAQQLQKLYETLPKCFEMSGHNITSTDIIQTLFYQMFGIWVGHIYEINKKYVYDECVASDRDRDFDDNYDVTKFHTFLLSEGFTPFMIDYDYYYINQWMIVRQMNDHVQLYCLDDIEQDNEFIKNIQYNLIVDDIEDDMIEVGILTHRNGTYFVSDEEFPRMDIYIDRTYNDDIPVEAFNDFIKNEDKGLCLMYGEPGTGKTTFIKHLIQEHKDKKFIILDSYLLNDITSHSLLSVFIENKDAIYILEDCEKLLKSREDINNPIISTFLNMSDGILASVIKCKFICTFNTDLKNIDDAIKRKGRMKLKYEFKKLACDKCKKIESSVNEPMTIADLIHIKKENDFSKSKKKKIGFIA